LGCATLTQHDTHYYGESESLPKVKPKSIFISVLSEKTILISATNIQELLNCFVVVCGWQHQLPQYLIMMHTILALKWWSEVTVYITRAKFFPQTYLVLRHYIIETSQTEWSVAIPRRHDVCASVFLVSCFNLSFSISIVG